MKKYRFSILVNCNIADTIRATDMQQDFQKLYEDHGFIMLPDGYSEDGQATRLVIHCHGAGGTVTTDDSQVEHTAITQYLVANGYAVMDVNGLPDAYAKEKGIDIRNNIGSPIAIRSYVKAYHYCMEKFNLLPEVFVHGGSMGGISSTNLVLSGMIPVIAHSAYCPVLDTYHQIFLHPWSDGLPKFALGKLYGLEQDDKGEYIYDENKVAGYNPAKNKKAEVYPVPVKFWHCADDGVVSYETTRRFVDTIRENGGIAYLRTFSYGGHEPQLVGEFIKNPCGCGSLEGKEIQITPAVEETFIWIRNFS
ncbi:MAG: hypothetical protein E7408_05515 [Ruminococcaceae bacterium]|nr:hypothetical protein [Oscillospiraceae bacterium]